MDNGRGETTETNGMLLEDEFMAASPVAPQQPAASQSQEPVQPQSLQEKGMLQIFESLHRMTGIYPAVKKVNFFGGVIGAFIATLLCMAGMILLHYCSYYCLIGAAMYYVAISGYAKLGGRLDIKGIVICVLLTLPAVLIGHQAGWTLFFMKTMNKAAGITYSFSDFMNLLPNISNRLEILDRMLPLKDSGKLMDDYYEDTFVIIVCYLVIMVWNIWVCIIMLREKHFLTKPYGYAKKE